MKKIPVAVLAAYLIVFTTACKKDISQLENSSAQTVARGVLPPPLDWENINQMPTTGQTIGIPWGSSISSRQFSQDIVSDFKSADGWILLYNTFSSTSNPDNYYFVLYNRYRGLLRMYYYVPQNTDYTNSANILDKLAIEGPYAPNSPILNFADQDVVDVTHNSSFASTIQQWQVARSTWYVLQYELAYDQNMSTQNYTTFDFLWGMHTTLLTNVNINGTITGTLTGNINIPGTDFSIAPAFNISSSSNNTTITVNGSNDADKLKPSLGQTIVNNIKSAITNGAQGIIKNLLSGIFKKSSAPAENVNLKLNASAHLEGSLTGDALITSPAFAIPGYNQSQTPGYIPAHNEALGVFYISSRPTVHVVHSFVENPDGGRQLRQYTFSVTPGSFSYIFNPVVQGIASFTNFNAEVMVDDPGMDIENSFISGGEKETIGTRSVYRITDPLLLYDNLDYTGKVFVRLSFDVVPNDGNPAVRIAKTFLANTN